MSPVMGVKKYITSKRDNIMLGNVNYQVQRLFRESGINQIGSSKHLAKEEARRLLAQQGEKASWHSVGKQLGIYSYRTADAYRDIWKHLFHHAKTECGIRDIENLSADHVKSYLKSKIIAGVSRATFAQYAAGIEKLETALNLFSQKFNRGNEYSFSLAIDEARSEASGLNKFSGSRAYRNPEVIPSFINNQYFRLVAEIQLGSGARVYEASLILPDQLKGLGADPITGKQIGVVSIEGKGGKNRDLMLPLAVFQKLDGIIDNNGKLQISKRQYQHEVRQAALQAGERPHGTHGFRWNWAQKRFQEVQQAGFTYEQALSWVSKEMGHVRADITEHYLC
jgi:hypothetical protein